MTSSATTAAPAPTAQATPAISLQGLGKSFGQVHAVHELDLDIRQGEFFSLLGPSGSGKTTVLRLIAGFELPTSGAILLGGKDVTRSAPFERNVNTVFQDYALFPHLTVAKNVEYGLKLHGVPAAERKARVAEALEMIRLPHVADRLPSQLSGGQRQRVALARALVLRPEVLLLDEPLGALDKQLREQMQIELKQIQREVGITFVFVTHDQEEALTLSDRVAVFNEGKIQQVGSPEDLYQRPATEFVAGFLGSTNLIDGALAAALTGTEQLVSLRPERVRVGAPGEGEAGIAGVVAESVFTGPGRRLLVTPDGFPEHSLLAEVPHGAPGSSAARGERLELAWPREAAYAVPRD
ncbi:ABC transporter ATP-binding protein [Galactobacter valiniphilus]|uniref:ABC transporter ATP-binding protein n=1 Tax=Galactobacter valiniphilus TaxID=2676122 RepID=UPI003734E4CB